MPSVLGPDQTFNDVVHNGTHSFSKAPNFPSGSIENTDIVGSAGVDASKLKCHYVIVHEFAAPGTEPATSTEVYKFTAPAAGAIVSFKALATGVVPSSGAPVQYQLKKSTGGGALSTVLSNTVHMDDSETVRVPLSGTVASSTFSANDHLAVSITVGTTTPARGAVAIIHLYHDYA